MDADALELLQAPVFPTLRPTARKCERKPNHRRQAVQELQASEPVSAPAPPPTPVPVPEQALALKEEDVQPAKKPHGPYNICFVTSEVRSAILRARAPLISRRRGR